MISKVLLYVGALSLFHAAFSAAQHKSFRRLVTEVDEESPKLPADIVCQAIISMLVLGVIIIRNCMLKLREINFAEQINQQSYDFFVNSPSFYNFCHRGRILKPM